MVRAGKVGKGFTPRAIEEQREADKETEEASTIIPNFKKWWSAFVIQRAWRRKREHRTPLQWEGSGASSGSKLDLDCARGETSTKSRSDVINYARKNQVLRLLKNLTTRLLEARPQDAKAYLLRLLEAWKANRMQKDAFEQLLSDRNERNGVTCAPSQIPGFRQSSVEDGPQSVADPLTNRLGIFSEKDLQVLFDYCARTKGAGVAKELKEREHD